MYQRKDDVYRSYRRPRPGYFSFRVAVGETDLWLETSRECRAEVEKEVRRLRRQLRAYISRYPDFLSTLKPWPSDPGAPELVQRMIAAAAKTGVGPMAAVAGAIAEMLGHALLAAGVEEFFIENGGDLYFTRIKPRLVAVYAGSSPFSWQLGLKIPPGKPLSVCTSSGTVGHSFSMGRADAAVVLSPDGALADAAATAAANRVQGPADLEKTAEFIGSIPGVTGVLLICGETLAALGDIELADLSRESEK
ncbi:MAG: UPF0280 family protein [Firmicutes bacterium]|jgi:ApbE superfamily uncharacterized protein (UPF0280 family)|nr:UPF0280 family protein [Bacillota bacterium]